jgi:hypothetical protein
VGTQESVRSANRTDPRSDAAICMFGAMRLRNRPMWHLSRDDLRLFSATSQLLEALGRALARDAGAVPAPVRRAALRLARHCSDNVPSAAAGADHDNPADPPRPPPGTSGEAGTASRGPFCASIELGRMG